MLWNSYGWLIVSIEKKGVGSLATWHHACILPGVIQIFQIESPTGEEMHSPRKRILCVEDNEGCSGVMTHVASIAQLSSGHNQHLGRGSTLIPERTL
jgi:hypothetical protein